MSPARSAARAGFDSARETPAPFDRCFALSLAGILIGALVWRGAYLWAQPATDPFFDRPILDGAYYLDWARAIAGGTGGPASAFYLAPLYPYAVALFRDVFGESPTLLFACQQLLSVATAGLIALGARRSLGGAAALAAAALYLLYAPTLFFASRPVGESLALFLLFAALLAVRRPSPALAASAGLLAGLAALARPNLLLVGAAWVAGELLGRRWKRAAWIAAGVVLAVAPVTVRNLASSGHLVLISSNGGMTAYHGNGPGARGIFTQPPGFSGSLPRQREEATALARRLSGRELDPVEADRWWGGQALRTRLDEPGRTLGLLARRALLMVDSFEHGLDYPPSMDSNPWRPTIRLGSRFEQPLVPFALILALAVAGLVAAGAERSGGWIVWSAVATCAAAPLLFYVSSRYRLPLAAMLVLPAGAGVRALLCGGSRVAGRRRWVALAAGAAIAALSLAVPSGELRALERAAARSNRSVALKAAGNLAAAEREARAAVELDPESTRARFNLGVILEARGLAEEARRQYRDVLERDPWFADAAGNLAALLIRDDRPAEAVPLLRAALALRPDNAVCWNNLVVALVAAGDLSAGREAALRAERAGVGVDPGLLDLIRGEGEDGGQGEGESMP